MLKRIVVTGDEALLGALRKAANPREFEVLALESGQDLPTGTVAVTGGADAEALVAAAGALGERHEAVLGLIGDALDVRESLPGGSSRRVHEHCVRFARALNLDPADELALSRAGFIREIGKLSIPNDVLLKRSVLTYEEWITLQRHTSLGAELLQRIGLFTDCVDIVHYHHESWDGTGYPERREREEIPLLARAMRIADVYCAMTSPRTYRKSFSTHEQAVDHLRSERGKHFDPGLLDTFLDGGVARPLEYMPAE
jgi:HD-GYP domain-containing protein (c-di-GMP phosphodiesterase class II)